MGSELIAKRRNTLGAGGMLKTFMALLRAGIKDGAVTTQLAPLEVIAACAAHPITAKG